MHEHMFITCTVSEKYNTTGFKLDYDRMYISY